MYVSGIRQLQCVLMKVALLVGVEIHVNVSFDGLIEPPDDQSTGLCRGGNFDGGTSIAVAGRNSLSRFHNKMFYEDFDIIT